MRPAPVGPYGLVNLWDSLPDVWRGLGYADVYVHLSGQEVRIVDADGEVVLRRDASRRGGYACSCPETAPCRHVRALAAAIL